MNNKYHSEYDANSHPYHFEKLFKVFFSDAKLFLATLNFFISQLLFFTRKNLCFTRATRYLPTKCPFVFYCYYIYLYIFTGKIYNIYKYNIICGYIGVYRGYIGAIVNSISENGGVFLPVVYEKYIFLQQNQLLNNGQFDKKVRVFSISVLPVFNTQKHLFRRIIMNILDRISADINIEYRKAASTRGGEYWGPCPWCGGDDRFSIHPVQDHYVCRGCRKAGDSIKWLRDYHHQSYLEACRTLGIQPNMKFKSLDATKEQPGQNEIIWTPREVEPPPLTWQRKAEQVLFSAYKTLLSSTGKKHRDWLNARGISNSTIKTARLGLVLQSLTFDMETWGLPSTQNKHGKNKQIWLPAGLIIPYFQNGSPVRLRIRQDNPVSSDRYIIVSGSSTAFFDYNSHQNTLPAPGKSSFLPYICTESELDGWLIHQEARSLVDVFSIGNAQSRPDKDAHNQFNNRPGLVNLDNDEAGQKEQAWWSKQYPSSRTYPSLFGKDPGEDFEFGQDIHSWVQAGITSLDMQGYSASSAPVKQIDRKKILSAARKRLEAQHVEIAKKQQKKVEQATVPESKSKRVKQVESNKDCLHGQYCVSCKDGNCLIAKQTAFSLPACPKDYWRKIYDESGIFTQIIFGLNYKEGR